MSKKKKWIVLAVLGTGFVLAGMGLLLVVVFGFFAGHAETAAVGLPAYATAQTASSHAGYRHSTLTSGGDVYVNDYEEAGLQLADPEPSTMIGYIGPISNAKVCAISGQPTNAYIAGDQGSEMPAYVPFRHTTQRAFDWRTAVFHEMKVYGPKQSSARLTSTDATMMAEVIRTLSDGKPVTPPGISFASIPDLTSLKMSCDQLPGLLFCPSICTDAAGQFYIAESLMYDMTSTPPQVNARWIPVSEKLAAWLKGP